MMEGLLKKLIVDVSALSQHTIVALKVERYFQHLIDWLIDCSLN